MKRLAIQIQGDQNLHGQTQQRTVLYLPLGPWKFPPASSPPLGQPLPPCMCKARGLCKTEPQIGERETRPALLHSREGVSGARHDVERVALLVFSKSGSIQKKARMENGNVGEDLQPGGAKQWITIISINIGRGRFAVIVQGLEGMAGGQSRAGYATVRATRASGE